MATLVFCTLLATASAIVFGFVYGIVILTVVFGHPLFWFAGLMLGPLAGAIGGPVFGVAYGAAMVWRGRAMNRSRSVLLAGVLGGVIFAAVGTGFHAWEASERSYQPTKRPILVSPEGGRAVERREPVSASSGAVNATPDGGGVTERRNRAPESDGPVEAAFALVGFMALGGFLFGALFSAMFGRWQREEQPTTK